MRGSSGSRWSGSQWHDNHPRESQARMNRKPSTPSALHPKLPSTPYAHTRSKPQSLSLTSGDFNCGILHRNPGTSTEATRGWTKNSMPWEGAFKGSLFLRITAWDHDEWGCCQDQRIRYRGRWEVGAMGSADCLLWTATNVSLCCWDELSIESASDERPGDRKPRSEDDILPRS